LATHGWKAACTADTSLARGLNVVDGKICYAGVAEAFELASHEVGTFLA
jgi:alanine dehydrogenase